MIEQLRVARYKGFRHEESVAVKPLTILLGKNSSGKTSLARLPLLVLSTISQRSFPSALPPMETRGLVFGSNPIDLVNAGAPHGSFDLGITFETPTAGKAECDFRVQLSQSIGGGRVARASLIEGPGRTAAIGPDGLNVAAEEALASLTHLVSIREPLHSVYERKQLPAQADVRGAAVPTMLSTDPELALEVSRWYEEYLDVSVALVMEAKSFSIEVASARGRANLVHAGQGFQQALPVVAYLNAMALRRTNNRVLVVEEPELHLHPAVHPGLADLVATALNKGVPGSQVVIETHSENLVLRIRRHVASGNIAPEDVQILWFDESRPSSAIDVIDVNRDGSVSGWPAGVFSEDLEEVRGIQRAGREA